MSILIFAFVCFLIIVVLCLLLCIIHNTCIMNSTDVIPTLILLMYNIPGNILELGVNDTMTPMLKYLNMYQRSVKTYDTSKAKINKMKNTTNDTTMFHQHEFINIGNSTWFDNVFYPIWRPKQQDRKWGLINRHHFFGIIILNHNPYRRRWKDLWRLRNSAYAIVLCQSNPSFINKWRYGKEYMRVINTFKYKHCIRSTVIVSNMFDISSFFKHPPFLPA